MFRLNRLFGGDVISQVYPPTNSEFIMTCVSYLRTELQSIREM